jgi:hypothetical protein
MKTLSAAILAGLLAFATAYRASAADPDPQAILRDARMAQTGQYRTLKGHLLAHSTGAKIPFTMDLAGNVIRYEFADRDITLKLGDTGAQLFESAHGETQKITPARYDKPVEGTDVTYEDLSLRFMYWPKAKVDGTDPLGVENCWKLHIEPGGQASSYKSVELWVAQRGGYLLKGECYNAAGKLVRRFEVRSSQADPNGGRMLKTMEIASTKDGEDQSVTDLTIDKQ